MKAIITGGTGFIGVNAAKALLRKGYKVVIFDNCSRKGWQHNITDLRQEGAFEFIQGDLRDFETTSRLISTHGDANLILHLAAQVAVTSSVLNPREDFETNALGTFNLLEAVRTHDCKGFLIYSSTNKVYGGMENISVIEKSGCYAYQDLPMGISEKYPLDFHSPYGCSKGAADQYVHDYARIYGLQTAIFRQSCIYGPHQYGVEDQGWVAWFTIAALTGQRLTIYGNGKQVRDVLYVDDLVEAFIKAYEFRDRTSGQAYNMGGGPNNVLSLLNLLEKLKTYVGKPISPVYSDWRPGDQKVFVADIRKAQRDFKWEPSTSIDLGINRLFHWVQENRERFIHQNREPFIHQTRLLRPVRPELDPLAKFQNNLST